LFVTLPQHYSNGPLGQEWKAGAAGTG